jgi:uroporphyrinogen decarboxylase
MTSQERVLLAIARKEADRIPVHDSPWGTTEARWHREGLPEGVASHEHFGFEFWGAGGDNSLQLETCVVEDTDEYVISTGPNGNTIRNWKHSTSTPELIDFTVTSREKWEELKPLMAWNDKRVDWDGTRKGLDWARERGLFCFMTFGPGFTRTCDMVGPERVLMAMIEDPAWVHDMFMTDAQVCADMAEELLSRGYDLDAGWIFDDLGFKHRGFFSPAMYRELLMPAHKLIIDVFHRRGKPMLLHSCGYVMEFVPSFIEVGFDCLQPLEVKAGNDLLALKRDFGDRLAFMGGIDVRAMADADPAAIEREIASKVPIAKQGGGYIFHSDHSVPDNVSFAQYTRVMELAAHYGKY